MVALGTGFTLGSALSTSGMVDGLIWAALMVVATCYLLKAIEFLTMKPLPQLYRFMTFAFLTILAALLSEVQPWSGFTNAGAILLLVYVALLFFGGSLTGSRARRRQRKQGEALMSAVRAYAEDDEYPVTPEGDPGPVLYDSARFDRLFPASSEPLRNFYPSGWPPNT